MTGSAVVDAVVVIFMGSTIQIRKQRRRVLDLGEGGEGTDMG